MKRWFVVVIAVSLPASAAIGKIGGGVITYSVSGAGAVSYSHNDHVIKAKLKCSECHYQIFNTKETHKKVTMGDMRKGASCGACHDGRRAFDVKANCGKCHE